MSRGRAVGRIVCIYGGGRQFFRTQISAERIDKEIARLRNAISLAGRRLNGIGDSASEIASSSASIFDMHRAILEDNSFREKIENAIAEKSVNAEWAVKVIADEYAAKYRAIPDEHFRDRYIDVEDVAEQIHSALGGGRQGIQLSKNSIIAASEIRPSTVAEFARRRPAAIITENGGWTSHAFILARELEIPAVTGLRKLLRRVSSGDLALVDALEGKITLHPGEDALSGFKHHVVNLRENDSQVLEAKSLTKTLDGHEVKIRANFDIADSFHRAKNLGARGIGLFRSEYLFNRYKGFPGEAEQLRIYREIADFAGIDRARIRLFDLGVHQISEHPNRKEPNPALGLRGIRLGLNLPRQLRTQIRALLQASYERHIDVVIPMISGVEEIDQVRRLIERESERLAAKQIPIGEPRIAAMIELPSAVLNIKSILQRVDSVCIGTNDLVQYLLAVDRDNESVADWFRTLHPSVISALRLVIEAANAAGKPAVVCGEMAGSPFYVPILIGLGASELSMNVNSIMRVRSLVSGIAREEADQLVRTIESRATTGEIEAEVESFIAEHWSHLFPADSVLNRKV